MKNRFKLNEEEKNRIRGMHGIQVINEQTRKDRSVYRMDGQTWESNYPDGFDESDVGGRFMDCKALADAFIALRREMRYDIGESNMEDYRSEIKKGRGLMFLKDYEVAIHVNELFNNQCLINELWRQEYGTALYQAWTGDDSAKVTGAGNAGVDRNN